MDTKELTLVENAAAGDMDAFELLYRGRIKAIHFRAVQCLGNQQDAEDAVQEIVLAMYQNIRNLREPQAFGAWLSAIIANRCNMILKKRYKNKNLLALDRDDVAISREVECGVEFLPQDFAEDSEKRAALIEIIDQLPAKNRNALILFYFEGLSCAEIAKITGTKPNTVTAYISRGRDMITQKLEKRYGSLDTASSLLAATPVMTAVFQYQADAMLSDTGALHLAELCGAGIQSFQAAGGLGAAGVATITAKSILAQVWLPVLASVVIGGALFLHPANFNISAPATSPTSPVEAVDIAPQPVSRASTGFGVAGNTITSLSGQVRFRDHRGAAVTTNSVSPANLRVVLYDLYDRELASGQTGPDGRFSIAPLALSPQEEIQVAVQPLEADELLSTANVAFRLNAGAQTGSGTLDVYLTVTQTPRGHLAALDAGGRESERNPAEITFVSERVEIAASEWSITDTADGRAVQTGAGTTIQAAQLALPNGSYTVHMTVTDCFGNTTEKKVAFVIEK